jgi:hypothetical protein
MHCCNVNFPPILFCENILAPNAQRIAVVKKNLFITFTLIKNISIKSVYGLIIHQAG